MQSVATVSSIEYFTVASGKSEISEYISMKRKFKWYRFYDCGFRKHAALKHSLIFSLGLNKPYEGISRRFN